MFIGIVTPSIKSHKHQLIMPDSEKVVLLLLFCFVLLRYLKIQQCGSCLPASGMAGSRC